MSDFLLKTLAFSLETFHVRGKSFKLTLSSHGLLEDHFNTLETLLLVLELTAEDIVAKLAVATSFISQVIQHAVRSYIVAVHLADIHKALLYSEELRFIELDHVREFAFLLRKLSILLLLFSKLRRSLQKGLEILLVALCFEKINFCQQLILFLFKLCDFLFKVSWVHGLRAEAFHIHMSCLELSLEILINLEGVAHFIINQEFIRNGKWNQEFGSVSFALELLESSYDPEENVLNGSLVTMNNISLKVRVEVRRISENLKEAADSLLGLVLLLLLDIYTLVLVIQVT